MKTKNNTPIVKAVSELTKKHIDNKIPYINWGGCGIVAEHLHDLFTSIGVKDIEIVLLVKAWRIEDMDYFLDNIKKRRLAPDFNTKEYSNIPPFSHIILRVDGVYIDSEGVYKDWEQIKGYYDTDIVFGMDYDLLHKINRKPSLWNRVYKRKLHNKDVKTNFRLIEKKIKKDLVMSK